MNGNNIIEINYYCNRLLLRMSELALLHRQVALKSGGATIKNWEGTISEGYKSGGGAPIVKVTDFTLASKNRGDVTQCPTELPPSSPY